MVDELNYGRSFLKMSEKVFQLKVLSQQIYRLGIAVLFHIVSNHLVDTASVRNSSTIWTKIKIGVPCRTLYRFEWLEPCPTKSFILNNNGTIKNKRKLTAVRLSLMMNLLEELFCRRWMCIYVSPITTRQNNTNMNTTVSMQVYKSGNPDDPYLYILNKVRAM